MIFSMSFMSLGLAPQTWHWHDDVPANTEQILPSTIHGERVWLILMVHSPNFISVGCIELIAFSNSSWVALVTSGHSLLKSTRMGLQYRVDEEHSFSHITAPYNKKQKMTWATNFPLSKQAHCKNCAKKVVNYVFYSGCQSITVEDSRRRGTMQVRNKEASLTDSVEAFCLYREWPELPSKPYFPVKCKEISVLSLHQ